MRDLAGKTAFVTGAGSGIGLGIATALAGAGMKVMLCDIEATALEAAVKRLSETNAEVDGVLADVSLKDELQRAADATIARFGAVHVLVNNAGVGGRGGGPYGTWSDEGWAWVMGVNLQAVIWGVGIFGPLIESHGEGGHIVSTASVAGLLGGANAYNVSKTGVVSLSEGLRMQLAPRNIGVSVLCPGIIRTNIADAERNRPERFGEGFTATAGAPPPPAAPGGLRARLAEGIDPRYVGELVREAIENDWDYIFTDPEFERAIDARFARIKAGFDRIRERTPTH